MTELQFLGVMAEGEKNDWLFWVPTGIVLCVAVTFLVVSVIMDALWEKARTEDASLLRREVRHKPSASFEMPGDAPSTVEYVLTLAFAGMNHECRVSKETYDATDYWHSPVRVRYRRHRWDPQRFWIQEVWTVR